MGQRCGHGPDAARAPNGKCRACRKESSDRYRASPKGQAALARQCEAAKKRLSRRERTCVGCGGPAARQYCSQVCHAKTRAVPQALSCALCGEPFLVHGNRVSVDCDPGCYRFEKGDALGEEKPGILTRVGARIAGVLIVAEVSTSHVEVECACGTRYQTFRSTVTGAKRKGTVAKCRACVAKARTEAQRRRGEAGRLSRDQANQQQREKQGAAA